MLSELRYGTLAESQRLVTLMWTSNDMGMGKPSIIGKGRNGPEQRSPGKYNSQKFLRNSVGEIHQSLFPHLEADMTALM